MASNKPIDLTLKKPMDMTREQLLEGLYLAVSDMLEADRSATKLRKRIMNLPVGREVEVGKLQKRVSEIMAGEFNPAYDRMKAFVWIIRLKDTKKKGD